MNNTLAAPSPTPPMIPPTRPSSPATNDLIRFETEKKSAGVGLFLCWVIGTLGAHRFYMGRPHAVTMLIITLVSIPLCFVLIGFFGYLAVWIWVIIDLFSVSRWVKEYNTALLSRIQVG